MEQVHQYHDKYFEVIDRTLQNIPLARQLEAKTGVPKVYGALGLGFLVFSLVFFNVAAPLLVNLVGFGYAAYASMAAIESPGKEDDAQWLTYWVVFGLSNVAEYFTSIITYWIPFYYVFKLVFLVWLMAPRFRGAERLYQTTLRPMALHAKKTAAAVSAEPAVAKEAKEGKKD